MRLVFITITVVFLKEMLLCYKYYGSNYLTKNQEAMKEFMWVKLKAKPIE